MVLVLVLIANCFSYFSIRGVFLMYEFCFVFEYCLVSSSKIYFPSNFAQWNESLYVDTRGTDVTTVLEEIYQYVRSYHTAYSRIRGVLYCPLVSASSNKWVKGTVLKYRWLDTRPTDYVPMDVSNGIMFNTPVSNPNNTVLPLCLALRLRLVLSPPIAGRKMYKYIRNLPFQYNQDIRTDTSRTHLPFFALDSTTLQRYNTFHKTALTNSSVLNSSRYHLVALGRRNNQLWASRIVGYESPHLTTTSRSFTLERYT